MKKLLYILPEYYSNTPTHHAHIFELLEKLGQKIGVFLLIEKSVGKPEIKNLSYTYTQKINAPIFNLFERLLVICWVRLLGYRTAYIHYSYWGAILSSLVLRPTGGKVYYWHCEVYNQFYSKFRWNLAVIKKKLQDEWLMKPTLHLANYLVTGTSTVAQFYSRTFNIPPTKIKIVPNWVNLKRFRVGKNKKILRKELGLPENKMIVLFLHRLSPRKGADLLPQIAKWTSAKIKNIYFLVAGGGLLKKQLDKEIQNQRLKKYVNLAGPIPNLEVPRYLTAADLLIMPSRQEGFPRVLIECMATGLPFVASDVGGTKDILSIRQKKHLIPAGKTKVFTQKVVALLNNPQELKILLQEGKKQVLKYSLEKISKQFVQLFS